MHDFPHYMIGMHWFWWLFWITLIGAAWWTFSRRAAFEFVADNAGRWFFHCHNVYHLEAGMAREVRYL